MAGLKDIGFPRETQAVKEASEGLKNFQVNQAFRVPYASCDFVEITSYPFLEIDPFHITPKDLQKKIHLAHLLIIWRAGNFVVFSP
jgi:hypothetical protein